MVNCLVTVFRGLRMTETIGITRPFSLFLCRSTSHTHLPFFRFSFLPPGLACSYLDFQDAWSDDFPGGRIPTVKDREKRMNAMSILYGKSKKINEEKKGERALLCHIRAINNVLKKDELCTKDEKMVISRTN